MKNARTTILIASMDYDTPIELASDADMEAVAKAIRDALQGRLVQRPERDVSGNEIQE